MNIDFHIETEHGVHVSINTKLTDAERGVIMASLLPVIALMVETERLELTGEDEPDVAEETRQDMHYWDGVPNR